MTIKRKKRKAGGKSFVDVNGARRVILAVALLVAACHPASAQDEVHVATHWTAMSVLALRSECNTSPGGFCQGYVVAIAESLNVTEKQIPYVPCWNPPNKRVSPEQLIAIVKKYIEAHPERWSEPGAIAIVIDALREAFPVKP